MRKEHQQSSEQGGGSSERALPVRSRGTVDILLRWVLLAVGASAFLAACWLALAWVQTNPLTLDRANDLSVTVLDRNDRLLRAYTARDGRWRLPADLQQVDQRYVAMLIAYEDKRFRSHHGVDPLAVGRAGWLLLRHRRIVSGGSTITMQVARLLLGAHDRSLWGKFRQAVLAMRLERRFSKDEILRLYLQLAPFGGNLEGVRAASLAYFGKEPRRLSVAEAALLVAIPQSPETRRPDRYPDAARRARNRVLLRMHAAGIISAEEAARASVERVPLARREFPMFAPHVADSQVEQFSGRVVHRLTLDHVAQANIEQLVREYAASLGGRLSAAVVVVDHRTGEVIVQVAAQAEHPPEPGRGGRAEGVRLRRGRLDEPHPDQARHPRRAQAGRAANHSRINPCRIVCSPLLEAFARRSCRCPSSAAARRIPPRADT